MKIKICSNQTCLKEYNGNSGHRKCPKCRSEERKKRCECGTVIWASSSQCIKCLGKSQSGENNPRYKAGRYTKNGYIMVLAPNHPRHKGQKANYVFEHILVMEEKLGRYLLPNENVHHINGIKDDNRIENLELWITSQPSGQRAEDLVVWAKQILALYDV